MTNQNMIFLSRRELLAGAATIAAGVAMPASAVAEANFDLTPTERLEVIGRISEGLNQDPLYYAGLIASRGRVVELQALPDAHGTRRLVVTVMDPAGQQWRCIEESGITIDDIRRHAGLDEVVYAELEDRV
jgi:hypothetical protein